jgi:hypothetical protein
MKKEAFVRKQILLTESQMLWLRRQSYKRRVSEAQLVPQALTLLRESFRKEAA